MSDVIKWFDCDRCGRDVERVQYVAGEVWCSDCWHAYNMKGGGKCHSCGGARCLKEPLSWLQRARLQVISLLVRS